MHTIFLAYLDRLCELHTDIERAIEGLSQSALDWVPGPDMNSICVLIVHLTGAERFWIGDVAGNDPVGRDRDAEFRARGLDASVLRDRLSDTIVYCRNLLGRLTIEDLESPRQSPIDGRQITVAWALAHALEHTGIHLGHIQITRQLWEQRRGA